MKLTAEMYLHMRTRGDSFEYRLYDTDMSEYDTFGICLGTIPATVEFDPVTKNEYIKKEHARLKAQQAKLQAETQVAMGIIQEKISKLLALEYTSPREKDYDGR